MIKKLNINKELCKELYKKYYNKGYIIKKKNIYQINREFEKEEWSGLLKKIKKIKKIKKKIKIDDIEKIYNDFQKKIVFFEKGNFYSGSIKHVIVKYNKIYRELIEKIHKKEISSIVELGAGYGSKIFHLADNLKINLNFFAGELTKNGRDIMKTISSKKKVKIFKYNLFDKYLKKIIPENSIVFTSYSLHYLPKLKKNFYLYFKKIKPNLVVHFEPVYETHKSNNLHGRLCRNYIHQNDYCKNFLTVIKKLDNENKIKILYFKKNIFGSNPLLPISIIVWKFN